MAHPHTAFHIISQQAGTFKDYVPTTSWLAWNHLLGYPEHPIPRLASLTSATLTATEAIAFADRTLAFTAIVYYGNLPIPAHLKKQYTFYHIDWWAPIAQRIHAVRPTSLVIAQLL